VIEVLVIRVDVRVLTTYLLGLFVCGRRHQTEEYRIRWISTNRTNDVTIYVLWHGDYDQELTPVYFLVNVHHLRAKKRASWPCISLKWLGGESCLSTTWQFGVLAR